MATKYESSLTGPEMDAALIDMAYHNSEAYAVGTRNGVPVGSSDVTYHNNSKYWAEQVYGYTDRAEDAANRAEAAVPSGTAGAVFFDRAQTLTSAQQSQARANIMAGGSNRNLLDNPWFTVNQRQVTSGTVATGTAEYFVDRWKTAYCDYTVNSDGSITTSWNGSGLGAYLIQYFAAESVALLEGKTVTLSVDINGNILTKTFAIHTVAGSGVTYQLGTQVWMKCNNVKNSNRGVEIQVYHTFTNGATIRAVKLELGSVSTLANDAPPNFVQELKKCQFYFKRFSPTAYTALWSGLAVNTTMGAFFVEGEMRNVRPVVTVSGTGYMAQEGSMKAITSGEAYYTRQGSRLLFTTSATLTNNKPVTVYTSANQGFVVDISAEL